MAMYRCRGVVLRTYKLGESDRIVVVVTDTHGKVRAVAKGVRRTKSRLGARLEPMTHVSLLLHEGRELDTVSQAEAVDHFRALREDFDRLTHASTLIEAVDHVAQERKADPRLYEMLVGALRVLNDRDAPALVGAFFWKLLAHEGYEPSLDACASCATAVAPDAAHGFDASGAGVLCRSCAHGRFAVPGAVELVRRTLRGGLNGVLAVPNSASVHEMERLGLLALEHVLERRLRSPRIFEAQ